MQADRKVIEVADKVQRLERENGELFDQLIKAQKLIMSLKEEAARRLEADDQERRDLRYRLEAIETHLVRLAPLAAQQNQALAACQNLANPYQNVNPLTKLSADELCRCTPTRQEAMTGEIPSRGQKWRELWLRTR